MAGNEMARRKRPEPQQETPVQARMRQEQQETPVKAGMQMQRPAIDAQRVGEMAKAIHEQKAAEGDTGVMLPNGTKPKAEEERVGAGGKIGPEDVRRAEGILQKYKDGKKMLEQRIVENEQWFKLRNWDNMRKSTNPGDPQPTSGWLFNSMVNKHADAMDNMPEPNVLPRERSDEKTAKILGEVIPAILDACDFETVYSDVWWYKLKTGTGVYGVFWSNDKQNGLGDIDIRLLDVLNLYWQPGIKDIQKSRNLFHIELVDADEAEEMWPELKGHTSTSTLDVKQYRHEDQVDDSEKTAIVDWYYKRKLPGGRTVLHYVKFACGKVLYASENDPEYAERGFYDHGKYPVVFDVMYPMEGSPCGFGNIDVCKSPQKFIDKLDQAMLKNAVMQARPRYFARQDGMVDVKDYADLEKDFIPFNGSGNPADSIMQVQVPVMGNYAMAMRTAKIDELKETSGNRDFQQGGTASGITAASAISALQEAGSKTSRDMIKTSYRALAQICYLCIDLIRQFYTEPRTMRIIGETGRPEYATVSAQMVGPQMQQDEFGEEMGERLPVFDIKVSAQRASPFATVAQNERAKELYNMGFFRPDLADQALATLEMMQFDGIEKVRERIMENGTMMQKLQQIGQIAMMMAQRIDGTDGTQFGPQIAQLMGMQVPNAAAPAGKSEGDTSVNSLGDTFKKGRQQTAEDARNEAARMSTPR